MVRLIIQRLLEPIAWCISQVRINRVTFEAIDGRDYVRKQRSSFGWILILIGNIVFKFRRVPLQVLQRQDWLDWEQRIQTATGVVFPKQSSSGLLTPKISGRLMFDVLSELREETIMIDHLAIALAELYRLHQIEIELRSEYDRKTVALSHGDASINNVIYDGSTESACWFDFDLRHDLRQPADLRHADDLRSFLFTAVQSLPPESCSVDSIGRLVAALKIAYPVDSTWESLVAIVNSRGFAIDVFHRAQMFRLKTTQNRKVERMLKDALSVNST